MALLNRCKGKCEHCGQELRGAGERHHRKRRRDGGDTLSNLLLLLPEHHVPVVHREVAWSQARGFIVPVLLDPTEEPVWYMGRQWTVLSDDGGMMPVDWSLDPI